MGIAEPAFRLPVRCSLGRHGRRGAGKSAVGTRCKFVTSLGILVRAVEKGLLTRDVEMLYLESSVLVISIFAIYLSFLSPDSASSPCEVIR